MTDNIELSQTQTDIVYYAKDNAIYLKTSSGSGKMRVLTERTRHLLTLTKRQILVLTFTHKATEEIKKQMNNISKLR